MFDFLKQRRNPPVLPESTVRRHFRIYGQVQGVGFRYRAKYAAQLLMLTGWVENLDDGSVEMEVQGDEETIYKIFTVVQQNDYVHITEMKTENIPVNPWERSFEVRGY